MNEKQFLKLLKDHAKSHNIKLNPDKKIVKSLIKGILENEKKKGFRYCTCRTLTGNKEEDKKKICPCVYHMKEIKLKGSCLCKLFLKGD